MDTTSRNVITSGIVWKTFRHKKDGVNLRLKGAFVSLRNSPYARPRSVCLCVIFPLNIIKMFGKAYEHPSAELFSFRLKNEVRRIFEEQRANGFIKDVDGVVIQLTNKR